MQPQPLTDTFIEAVRYIYYNRQTQERIQIDTRLLSLNHDPAEIDRAWRAVEAKQGWAILQEAKRKRNKRNLTPFEVFLSATIGASLAICLGFFLIIGSLLGWVFIGTWLYQRFYLPPFLVIPVAIGGIVFTFWSVFTTTKTYVMHKPNAGWGVLGIFVQFVIFVAAFFGFMGSPGPLPPFTHYPNSTPLTLPAYDPVKRDSPITLECEEDYFRLTPAEAFYTNDPAGQILDFYKQQAATMGRNGLTISNGWNVEVGDSTLLTNPKATTPDSAICYFGELWRIYRPINAVVILHLPEHKGDLTGIFPNLPDNIENVVIVFNDITSRTYI